MGLKDPRKSRSRRHRKRMTIEERFWAKVDKSGPAAREGLGQCWLWTGGKTRRGYGTFNTIDRAVLAHRLAWSIANDTDPASFCVCHHCDNPSCVNPSHLFLGTHAENMQDMAAKDRGTLGERARGSRLTAHDVICIRFAVALGAAKWRIAKEYGVSPSTIYHAALGRSWPRVA